MIELKRISIPNSLLIDNRRPGSKLPDDGFCFNQTVQGLEAFLRLTPSDLAPYQVIAIKGGDGTIQKVLRLTKDQDPTLCLLGGGSANTLLRGLARASTEQVPSGLQPYFDPDRFRANHYRPPLLTQGNGEAEPCSYLVSTSHLGVSTTIYKETITQGKFVQDPTFVYTKAALLSLIHLRDRVKPKDIVYRTDALPEWRIKLDNVAVLEAISVPVLATFTMKQTIDNRKIRLLMMRASSEPALFAKFAIALVVGGKLPDGLDLVIRMGLINTIDALEVSIAPDLLRSPNCCVDGQLETVRDEGISIRRSKKDVLIITQR